MEMKLNEKWNMQVKNIHYVFVYSVYTSKVIIWCLRCFALFCLKQMKWKRWMKSEYHVILGLEFLSYPGSIVYGVWIVACGAIVIIFILNNIIALKIKREEAKT